MADKEKPEKAPRRRRRRAKGGASRPARAAKRQGKGGDRQGRCKAPPRRRATPRPKDYKPRMKSHYEKVVREALAKKFGYKNPMQVPRLEKIVLNMGVGEAVNDRKKVDNAAGDLAMIAGQRPVHDASRASRSPPTRCARAWRSAPR